jgi:hypothetical protein
MPKVIVGMWCKDGYTKCPSDDWKARFQDLQKHMIKAFSLGPKSPPPDALHVFLAPEYYFRKDRKRGETANAVTAYTKEEYKAICDALKAQSKTLKNFLLVGGSVFWVEDEKKKKVRHTVPVYHDGKELLQYDKRNDCVELAKYEKDLGYDWKPGKVKGDFKVGKIRCGVETCIDQDLKELQKLGKDFDLHVIVSNTVAMKNPAAKATGFVLHCNASQADKTNSNFVYKSPFGLNDKVDGQSEGLVSCWELDLP